MTRLSQLGSWGLRSSRRLWGRLAAGVGPEQSRRRRNLERVWAVTELARDGLLIIGPEGEFKHVSGRLANLLGLSPGDSLPKILDLVAPEDRLRLERQLTTAGSPAGTRYELRGRLGSAEHVELEVLDRRDDAAIRGMVVLIRGVNAEVVLEEELAAERDLDALTRLPNRRCLSESVERMAMGVSADAGMGLILLNLDSFKDYNDSRGHSVGDQILREVASRLSQVLRAAELLVHLGGDEFAVLLEGLPGEAEAMKAAERFRGVAGKPLLVDGSTERLEISAGVVVSNEPLAEVELLRRADIALHEAKGLGGRSSVLFEEFMSERAVGVSRLHRALREAVFDEEFSLVYQPIVSARDGQPVAAEALLRWTSPALGAVSPGEFIPEAEQLGLISDIGGWVVESLCSQLADWAAEGVLVDVPFSFNVSVLQLKTPDFVDSVVLAAERYGIPPWRLIIEVTESTVAYSEPQVVERLAVLRELEFSVAIDDFGSGYSNFGQLVELPMDLIKVDRQLLLTLANKRAAAGAAVTDPCSIIRSIAEIASALGAPLLAEGVEDAGTWESLRGSGVTYLQGFLFGRPMAAKELQKLDFAASAMTLGAVVGAGQADSQQG